MSDSDACNLLALCAAPITPVLLEICAGRKLSGNRRSAVGTVATRLHIIRMYLDSLPPYLKDRDINQLSLKVLQQLIGACTVGTNLICLESRLTFSTGSDPSLLTFIQAS